MNTATAYEDARHSLALSLMDAKAVLTFASNHPLVIERDGPRGKERGFKLKLHEQNPDAPLSPIFLNLRTPDNPNSGPLSSEIVDLAARCMREVQRCANFEFDAIAPVPRAGDPFGRDLARLSGKPCLQMNKVDRDGDGHRRVTSLADADASGTVVLVDDLITKADSKKEAIDVLRKAGLLVRDVLVLVDRQQGGRAELAEIGCVLHSVFTIGDLLDIYVWEQRMDREVCENIRTYLGLSD
jgi:uridine monophosphate synthetase